jgi:hydrogenase expression/formation protein HypE
MSKPEATVAARRPSSLKRYDTIRLSHGSGGKLTLELIEDLFVAVFSNEPLRELTDAAILANPGGRIAFATDSHTVKPAFFPGGDIGRLAVAGTVNDLAVMGARPRLPHRRLPARGGLPDGRARGGRAIDEGHRRRGRHRHRRRRHQGARARQRRRHLHQHHRHRLPARRPLELGVGHVRPGDQVLVNGTLGDHGIAVMSRREGLDLSVELESDVAPLNGLIDAVLAGRAERALHARRDARRPGRRRQRGGAAPALRPAGVRRAVPVNELVEQYSEMLGIDPMLAANEGKVLVIVPPDEAEAALGAMKAHPRGREAAIIGDIVRKPEGVALVETAYGSRRVLEMPIEEQLPRIC